MKIAIDCCDLDHSRIDGTRVYIKNLLDLFGQNNSQDSFYLYHQQDFNPLLRPKIYSNYIDKKIPYNFLWTQTRFSYELRKDKPDVCWMPIQQMPYLADRKNTKFIVTIHDLAFKLFPDHFTWEDNFKLNLFADHAIKNADKIIAISEATKKDILNFYPVINKEKIKIIHHGFDRESFEKKIPEADIDKLKETWGIKNSKYILYVGAIQPRKDLVTLVKAFEEVKKNPLSPPLEKGENLEPNPPFIKGETGGLKLVFVGEPAWMSENILGYIKNSRFSEDIILTGKANFDDLVKFYRGAEVFVYPSLYEGFGIPILEGFASNVPVVTADNSSLVEVAGDAAKIFKTGDSHDLARSLIEILSHDRIREDLIEKGKKKVENFSWEKCARKTLEVIKRTADAG